MDPSNQLSGIVKYVATIAAGWMTAKLFKGQFQVDPVFVGGIITAVGAFVWQILHRKKVAAAQTALAQTQPITDPEKIAAIAKAA